MQTLHNTAPQLTQDDIYFFKEGSHFNLHNKLGAHFIQDGDKSNVVFSLWAPNAKYISVIGDFNSWDKGSNPMSLRNDGSGIWECEIKNAKQGDSYKYFIESQFNDYKEEKVDPFAFYSEIPPKSASKLWKLDYEWSDKNWMNSRNTKNKTNSPTCSSRMTCPSLSSSRTASASCIWATWSNWLRPIESSKIRCIRTLKPCWKPSRVPTSLRIKN